MVISTSSALSWKSPIHLIPCGSVGTNDYYENIIIMCHNSN